MSNPEDHDDDHAFSQALPLLHTEQLCFVSFVVLGVMFSKVGVSDVKNIWCAVMEMSSDIPAHASRCLMMLDDIN